MGTAWAVETGLNAASHMMGWGAATGGGTDSDAYAVKTVAPRKYPAARSLAGVLRRRPGSAR